MRQDVYQTITDKIISALEQGVQPWFKPWSAEHAAGRITRPLRANGVPIRASISSCFGQRPLSAAIPAPSGRPSGRRLSLARMCRKAKRDRLSSTLLRSPAAGAMRTPARSPSAIFPSLKGYTVFNVGQIDGLPAHFHTQATPRPDPVQRIERAETFFANLAAEIRHGGNMAYYSGASDHVQMPPFEAFRDAKSYYATLAHELTHWTKRKRPPPILQNSYRTKQRSGAR
jgi:antirestriction protein ArdC